MSQKINSNGLRLGVNKTWSSLWYADGNKYADQIHEDLKVRELIRTLLNAAGVDDIVIRRSTGTADIDVYVARPGVAIGKGGSIIDSMNKQLKKLLKVDVQVRVKEVKKPDLSASIIAGEIVNGLKRRVPPKLLALGYINKARMAGAKGIKIWISGRIGGAAQARIVKFSDGPVPLHTLKSEIDYASFPADTNDLGKFGVKVWIYKDNKLEEK